MDLYLFHLINGLALQGLWLDTLGIFFAKYLEFVLLACLLLFLIVDWRRYWTMVIEAAAAAVLARLVIVNFIRLILPRLRPFVENNVNLLLSSGESSFPSGHAAFYFAIATVVFIYNKKAGILFFVAAFLISIARIFVGIHWPTDILAGVAVGIFSGWLINVVSKSYLLKKAP